MLKQIAFELEGVCPLLLHNNQAANPLNPLAKELKRLSSKKNKSDEDVEAMARVEWAANMYGTEPGEVTVTGTKVTVTGFGSPCVPSSNLEKMLSEGAAKQKLGKKFKAAVFVEEDTLLQYEGPRTVERLALDPKFAYSALAKVGQATVLRTRPIFRSWSIRFLVSFMSAEVSPAQIRESLEVAGRIVGLTDWRPKYGRFTVKSAELVQ